MAEDLGGKIGLDTTDWKAGIGQINRDIRLIQSEFRAVAASMDDWKNSADGLSARNEALDQIIEAQTKKVAALQGQYDELSKETDENGNVSQRTAAALEELQIKINKAREELAKSQTEYRKNARSLDELKAATSESAEATEEFSSSANDAEKNTGKLSTALQGAGKAVAGVFSASIKAAAASLAAMTAAVGKAVTAGLELGSNYEAALGTIAAKTGASAEATKEMGDIALQVYGSGLGDSLGDVAEGLSAIQTNTGLVGDELKRAGEAGYVLRDTFGYDLQESANTASILMKTLGLDAQSAYDLIATGAQNGADKNGDMLDVLGEYSVQYDKLGLSADQMLQSLISGAESGAFSIDKIGDSVKEFSIRAVDGSDSSREAFSALGLDADEMFAAFAAGGDTARDAFFQVIERLQGMQDPLKQTQTGVALFGTQFEDLGAGVLPVLASMNGGITETKGAIDSINAVKYDTATDAIEGLKRSVEVGLIPVANEVSTAFKQFAQDASQALKDGFQPSDVQVIVESFKTNLQSLLNMANELMPIISQTISDVMRELVAILPGLINTLLPAAMSLLESLIDAIVENIEPITECAVSLVSNLAIALLEALPKLLEALPKFVATVFTTLGEVVRTTDWGSIGKALLDGVVNGLSSALTFAKETVVGFFKDIWTGVRESLGIHSPSTVAAEDGKNMLLGFTQGVEGQKGSALESMKSAFKSLWEGAETALGISGGEGNKPQQTGKTLLESLANGITAAKDKADQAIRTASTAITTGFKTLLGTNGSESTVTKPFGQSLIQGLSQGINGAKEFAVNAINTVSTQTVNVVKTALASSAGQPFGTTFVRGVAAGLQGAASFALNTMRTVSSQAVNAAKTALSSTAGQPFGSSFIRGVATGLTRTASSVASTALQVGRDITSGIANGMTRGVNNIIEAAKNVATSALSAAKRALGIRSPSKVMEQEVGLQSVRGIAQGITKNTGILRDSMEKAKTAMTDTRIQPISTPQIAAAPSQPVIVRAVLQLNERQFGELVAELSDTRQGFAYENASRLSLGVTLT